jgi:hypothetical protein
VPRSAVDGNARGEVVVESTVVVLDKAGSGRREGRSDLEVVPFALESQPHLCHRLQMLCTPQCVFSHFLYEPVSRDVPAHHMMPLNTMERQLEETALLSISSALDVALID